MATDLAFLGGFAAPPAASSAGLRAARLPPAASAAAAEAASFAEPGALLAAAAPAMGNTTSTLIAAAAAVAAGAAAATRRLRGGRRQGGAAAARRRGAALAREAARKTVFIDGEAGTTGIQVLDRLAAHPHIDILSLPKAQRRDEASRRSALREADAAVLCLPDAAAISAVSLVGDADTVIVDASTAHRVNDAWVYGFPELVKGQKELIAASKRIANPGCYPTGFIGLVRPLVDAGLLPGDALLTAPAVSGYSGGGKGLIELYEGTEEHEPWGAYGFGLDHKHIKEMAKMTGLKEPPIFCPAVGNFKQGMVVSVPLRLSQLRPGTTPADVQRALAKHYEGSKFVSVAELNPTSALERGAFLRPDTVNNTNNLELFVFGNEKNGTMWLLARLDNLGKGASGACVQNLNIALGFDEAAGLL